MFLKIWKEMKKKKFSPLYLLYGNEDFLVNTTKNILIEEGLQEDEKEFNLSVYDMEETPIDVALEDSQTIPFFGERKIVIIQNPYFLTAEKGKDKVDHNLKGLQEYIENPVPYTIFVIIAGYEKLDERKKLTKSLKKNAVVLEAKELNEKETKQWIHEQVVENGQQITAGGIDLLFQLIGPNLTIVHNELEKLFLYAGNNLIDEKMIHTLVPKSLEDNIFALVEQVVHHRLEPALSIYYDLLKQNEEPIKLLAVIASQLRFIYQVKTLHSKGYGERQISGLLKVHPYRVKLAIPQSRIFDERRLISMMNDLADLDYKMKTGYGNKEKLLEIFFFKYLSQDK